LTAPILLRVLVESGPAARCSHCEDQKEFFGAGAAVPYVECFPDGRARALVAAHVIERIVSPRFSRSMASCNVAGNICKVYFASCDVAGNICQVLSDGWERGAALATSCVDAKITGFPTWVLADGTRFEGEKTLAELAKATGFEAGRHYAVYHPNLPARIPTDRARTFRPHPLTVNSSRALLC